MSGYRENPVVARAGDGHVVGIATRPAGPWNGVRVLFLPGSGIASVGNARLFVELSRELAAEGCQALRADLPGCGESGGPSGPHELTVPFADDLLPLILTDPDGEAPSVLVGECLGGRVALALARRIPRLRQLVLLFPPVTMETADNAAARREAASLTDALAAVVDAGIPTTLVYGERDVDRPRLEAAMGTRFSPGRNELSPHLSVLIEGGKLHGIASRAAAEAVTRAVRLALREVTADGLPGGVPDGMPDGMSDGLPGGVPGEMADGPRADGVRG